MAKKNDTTNLAELLLQCMGEADPMLSMRKYDGTGSRGAYINSSFGSASAIYAG